MNEFILMLVILNPFAQTLYLFELMNKLNPSMFWRVHLRASLIALIIFLLFAFVGENYILKYIFQVRLASLQIFGGIIMLFLAFRYIIKGPGSNLMFRGDISELAPNISLPYMVGPGTLWAAMIIGEKFIHWQVILIIALVILTNFLFIIIYQKFHYNMSQERETRFSKYLAILMRTNAFFIGAIAVEMLLTGMESVIKKWNLS